MPDRKKRDIHIKQIFYSFWCFAIRFQEIPIEIYRHPQNAELVIFNFVPDIKT